MAAAALLLTLLPPAQGAMLVVTWGATPPAAVALDAGATLLGAGPLPRSLIVQGSRARLLPALLAAGGFALAAPAILCSRTTRAA